MPSIDEPIHIVEPSDAWPRLFALERARVCENLKIPFDRVEHIGSTAVPDLPAKPVIDIMVGADNWPPPETLMSGVARLGYESLGEAGVPERLYFRMRGSTDFNLHVVRFDGAHWRTNLALRNYLRSSQDARIRYAQSKHAAIASGAATLLAYSEAKASIVAALIQEAIKPVRR